MRSIHAFILCLACTAISMTPTGASAQSITTQFAGGTYCPGSELTVSFTATGTFETGNTFILQLSSPDGSFTKGFQNIASLSQTTSGAFTFSHKSFPASTTYRVRVISSKPVVLGSDNGTDFTLGRPPGSFDIEASRGKIWDLSETTIFSIRHGTTGSAYLWDFGQDASPATSTLQSPPPVSYSSAGWKTITLTLTSATGCARTETREFYVVEPTITAAIPADVKIATIDNADPGNSIRVMLSGYAPVPVVSYEAGTVAPMPPLQSL